MKPLGTVDSSFLLIENRTMPMHTGGLLLFSYPEGAHEEWLHEAFTANDDPDTVQYPFNQKLAWPLRRLGLPHWVTDHDLDTHYHVRHSALPKPGRYREMFSLVSRLHSTRLHRDRPLWEAHVIEGVEDNRFALYVKTHHSMIDGVGAMRMLRACLSADPNERDMPAPWNTPRARPESNGSATSGNVIAAATGALGGVLKFASAVRDRGEHGMMAPFQTPLTMLNRRVTGSRRFVAQSWSLPRIKKVAKTLNATVNDIVLAMSGGALRRYLIDQGALPDQPLTAMTPVSFRAADAEVEGNSFSVMFATLATEIGDPLDRLRAIQNSMGEAKRVFKSMNSAAIPIFTSIIALPIVLPHLLRLSGRTRPTFNVTVSNVPGPREKLYWNGAPLEGMYPLSIVTQGQALNITVTSVADSLDFGIIACRRSVPSAQRLIDHLEEALVELEQSASTI
ncbi:MAG: wax ester/triacylglycerol synthase family O-acyltransferase [Deltaproteobacteria bacterium]|nr:wax ester/triacylglycerol synthase family O-acyltransferase [Deltaproteobacteria bacterium]RLB47822.1 MAG: wax ester/triacylglycerol synthase family O-acyltransferase [Deltaproteobacteria bacterium]